MRTTEDNRNCPKCEAKGTLVYASNTVYRVIDTHDREILFTGDGWSCSACDHNHLFDDDTDPRVTALNQIREDAPIYSAEQCRSCGKEGSMVHNQTSERIWLNDEKDEILFRIAASKCWYCGTCLSHGKEACAVTCFDHAHEKPPELVSVSGFLHKCFDRHKFTTSYVSDGCGVLEEEIKAILGGKHASVDACQRLSLFFGMGSRYLSSLQLDYETRESNRASNYDSTSVESYDVYAWRQEAKAEAEKTDKKPTAKHKPRPIQKIVDTKRFGRVEGFVEKEDDLFYIFLDDEDESVAESDSLKGAFTKAEEHVRSQLGPVAFLKMTTSTVYTAPRFKVIYEKPLNEG